METVTALVSTNYICQGEQVGTLWAWVLSQGITSFFLTALLVGLTKRMEEPLYIALF